MIVVPRLGIIKSLIWKDCSVLYRINSVSLNVFDFIENAKIFLMRKLKCSITNPCATMEMVWMKLRRAHLPIIVLPTDRSELVIATGRIIIENNYLSM